VFGRTKTKPNNRDDRNMASCGRNIDFDPLTEYPFYLMENIDDEKLRRILSVIRWVKII
jgi:hypothetical protein